MNRLIKYALPPLMAISAGYNASAQVRDDALFGNAAERPREGFIIAFNISGDKPLADMNKRFGLSYRPGAAIMYKKGTWLFGIKAEGLFGGDVKEDSLMRNIISDNGSLYNSQGGLQPMGIFQRGLVAGIEAGKVFLIPNQKGAERGILVKTGVGYMRHRINIDDRDNSLPQVLGEYEKGYDRLTDGMYAEQFVGYNHFGSTRILNYYFGLNLLAGFTEGRRTYLYDVARADKGSRVDMLLGFRAGLYITLFRRSNEEFIFN